MKLRWITVLLLLMILPVSVHAEGCGGCIRLKMAYDGRTISGGTVTLYDVTDSPEGIGILEMVDYAKQLCIRGVEKQVDASGEVIFDDLPAGKYLLVQEKAAPGFYPFKPFHVRLSLGAGGISVDSIIASPKLEPEGKLPQTGQLVWPAWVLVAMGALIVGIGLVSRKREE